MLEWYWVFVFYLFILHVKAAAVTIYLHRHIAHNSIKLKNSTESCFKFILWITLLYFENYKSYYLAQHSKHHEYSDTPLDPHSPHHYTLKQLFDTHHNEHGRPYYVSSQDFEKYSKNCVSNLTWLEKKLYHRFQYQGYWIWYPIILFLFGPIALILSLFILDKVISQGYIIIANYCYHRYGYETKFGNKNQDQSKNLLPIGILFCGEELHSNHHSNPGSSKFSMRWFEFDLGWVYIKILEFFNLLEIKYKTKQNN
jgi:stearoyl-CoA desaturase (Delta-9 desaturase)